MKTTEKDLNQRHKLKIRANATAVKKVDKSYVIKISIIAFLSSILLSFLADKSLSTANIIVAVIILLFFVLLGIIFDIIGIATTSANEKPFHSMSSRNIESAKNAVKLVRNAEKVSNICNDVIGDIASIINGSAGIILAVKLMELTNNTILKMIIPFVITALIAGLTIGGKALGKSVAINHSHTIVFQTAQIITFFIKKRGKNNGHTS